MFAGQGHSLHFDSERMDMKDLIAGFAVQVGIGDGVGWLAGAEKDMAMEVLVDFLRGFDCSSCLALR